jgi:hypothetical protein
VEHQVNDIIVEENFGGGMFGQLLKPYVIAAAQEYRDPVTEKVGRPAARLLDKDEWDGWSRTQKEIRICDVLEPILGNHRLVVDHRVIEDDLKVQEDTPEYSFVQQLTRMERLKAALPHEDRLEAVSMACSYWTEKMDRDKEKMHQKHQAELLEKQLKQFTQHVSGKRKARIMLGQFASAAQRFIQSPLKRHGK